MISKTIALSGHELHYADFGGEGPAIVLVHGLGGSHANWLAVAPALARHGRVLAPDLPGFGRSTRSREGTSLTILGQALGRFLDAMSGEPVHLVGNSMGGALSLLEAHARPARIASTLLVCPALPPPPGGARIERQWMTTMLVACAPGGHRLLRRRALRVGARRQVREMMALCCADPSRVPREVLDAHVTLATERGSTPAAHRAFSEAARSLMGHLLFRKPLRRALRASGPPALIVHGQRDRLVDIRASRVAAAANSRIELTEMPDVGHVPQIEVPEAFLQIASPWLDAQVRSTAARRSRPSFDQTSELS